MVCRILGTDRASLLSMARFFPSLDQADFRSEGEFTLFQELSALDDEFIVIHSLPWLRGRTKRVYSPVLQAYLQVSLGRKHLSGEVDFVILHARLGMLCIETKSGLYKPSGVRFIHERSGHGIDPLTQVKDNAFALDEMMKSWDLKCPVGYAVHFPDVDLDITQIASAYLPLGRQLSDGILILQKHRQDMPARIVQLMTHWKAALNYGDHARFGREIERFLEAVWPTEARAGHLGRKILADGELWLRLDNKQAAQVTACLASKRRLIAGFSGSGKTLIARAVAEECAAMGLKVLFLLKNRQITQKVAAQLKHLSQTVTVQTFHSYCESLGTRDRDAGYGEPNYDDHHRALHGRVDQQYAVLIVDEAQALNEADHLALRDHFANARQFLFADELQVLPGIETGSAYRFLEDTYGERFFYLATVYRNPGGITRRMLEMRPPRHEVNVPRPIGDADLSRTISWDIPGSIHGLRKRLLDAGAAQSDLIVLSQFPMTDLAFAERSTIAAYRGMEKPIVIVVAGADMDDATLACALGRATTQAHIVVPVQLLISRSSLKSEFLRMGLARIDLDRFIHRDAGEPEPRFIDNLVDRFAGEVGSHRVFGGQFSYAMRWRRWLYRGAQWNSRGAKLWGTWLELRTGVPVCGIDPDRNALTEAWLQDCQACKTRTPHQARGGCLTCGTTALLLADAASIAGLAQEPELIHTAVAQSVLNVAVLVREFQFARSGESVTGGACFSSLFLAISVIEFRMVCGVPVATKSQMEQWLREVLVPGELDDSIEGLAGRSIGSLCGQDLLVKIGPGRYGLIDPR